MLSFLVIARPVRNEKVQESAVRDTTARTEMWVNYNQRLLRFAFVHHLFRQEFLESLSEFSALKRADILHSGCS